MKHIPILSILSCICLASCANWQQTAVPLAELGLAAAAAKGVIQPGDAVTIGKGIAIITSEADHKTKAVGLVELGAQAAVDAGKISEGDKLLIEQATAIIVPAVPTTSAKQPVNPG